MMILYISQHLPLSTVPHCALWRLTELHLSGKGMEVAYVDYWPVARTTVHHLEGNMATGVSIVNTVLYLLILQSFCDKWEDWDPVNRFNHTSWVAVVTLTDRPKSVRNRCVIQVFGGVFVLSLGFLDFSLGVRACVIGLSQISSFFLLFQNYNNLLLT